MEKNDISPTIHKHVAVMFEGLIIQDPDEPQRLKKHWWQKEEEPLADDQYIAAEVRAWRANEMPLKSVIHMVNQLGMGVEVYTYKDFEFVDPIERWLARKGVSVSVYHYANVVDLRDDFKYNRDVHTFFTAYEEDAAFLGIRATVVRPDGTFGV